MLFNSLEFLVFFLVVLGGGYFVPFRVRWLWLLAASLYFYGIWNPLLLAQLLITAGAIYVLAIQIEGEPDSTRKRRWLTGTICLLLGNLFVFKYTAFANESFRAIFGLANVEYPIPVIHIVLPLGISFYTFQLVGYVVDVYKGMKAERHLGVFALYVAFFPKLVSGPIEPARKLLPQLHAEQPFDYCRVSAGLRLMLWGAFKKLVVADRLGVFVDQAYGSPQNHDGVAMTLATLMFAFQVYCDFSGYTDIALGVAETLGYKLTPNFNRPYFATSIQDFWKRWHISLTSWLTEYVYTPLTRTRRIKIKWFYLMLISLLATFVVSGLWHGANWTFVAWGALHGLYLVFAILTQKWWAKLHKLTGLSRAPRLHRRLKIASTFGLVCFAYILFQSSSISDALHIVAHLHTGWSNPMAGFRDLIRSRWVDLAVGVWGIGIVLFVDTLEEKASVREILAARPRWVHWALCYLGAVSIVLLGALWGTPRFIYVQF